MAHLLIKMKGTLARWLRPQLVADRTPVFPVCSETREQQVCFDRHRNPTREYTSVCGQQPSLLAHVLEAAEKCSPEPFQALLLGF